MHGYDPRRELYDHLFKPAPKRILSLDGGGVRGLITLGMLKQVETILRERQPVERQSAYRLSDYFDLIGGTSTGAIIATLLAFGYTVDEITTIYRDLAPNVFGKSRWLSGWQSKFDSKALKTAIDKTLGNLLRRCGHDPRDLGVLRMDTPLLRTGLALFTKRIDRGSVWVLTNNPKSKYWDPQSQLWREHFATLRQSRDFYPNSNYQLATILRASASAPFYLDGVSLDIDEKQPGHFLDGGASPFNNPAQELFLITTLKARGPGWNADGVSPYGFNWDTGANKLFMLSLGSGTWRVRHEKFASYSTISQAKEALLSIIDDASLSATTWMQAISESPAASIINGNLEAMHHLRIVDDPMLTFRRVSPRLEQDWLVKLDPKFSYTDKDLNRTRELDHSASANLERLLQIGTATGARDITAIDFPAAFDAAHAMETSASGLKPNACAKRSL